VERLDRSLAHVRIDMPARIHFSGAPEYRLRTMAVMSRAIVEASARRLLKGPRRPGWNWTVEIGTQVLKQQIQAAFRMHDVKRARRFLDSVILESPTAAQVNNVDVLEDAFSGRWIIPRHSVPQATVLYLHGGGYSFYPKSFYAQFIALIALSANSRTFALDYRLTPEHRFPTQLQDALAAYRWLLNTGTSPTELVIAGDSAGGNMTLGLLLSLRNLQLPLPALAIALSPPTDFAVDLTHGVPNAEFDWVNQQMLVEWSGWFCDESQRRDPLISPIYADLRGLPPIYMQDGGSEILHDSIQAFADCAKRQGADVILESWADMNHDFQFYGNLAPQSADALRRIGEVIESRVPRAADANSKPAEHSST
jgi:monoterpene epsilon-lactone hydrolase